MVFHSFTCYRERKMTNVKCIFHRSVIVLLFCVYVIICARFYFGKRSSTCNKFKDFRQNWRHGLQTSSNTRKDGINLYTSKQVTKQLNSYDIAIISMSKYWRGQSILPRKIYCESSNASILIRKASQDEHIKRADVLIFSGNMNNDHGYWIGLQRFRSRGQLWVHTTEESAFTSLSICPPMGSNISYNLSFTYHPKADISVPYGQFIPFQNNSVSEPISNFNMKSKLIVWVSSHCTTPMWRRSDLAYDLAKYLQMDTYGDCGVLSCPQNLYLECGRRFKSYKFYLAMENSCCGGYITEKFWKALTHLEAIPVVVGAPKEDYQDVAPNNSFIHADDFGSMKELADYILKVSESKELYDSYFQWKRLGKAKINPIPSILAFNDEGVCRTIEYIKSSSRVSSTVPPFDPYGPDWFGGCNQCGEKEWLRKYSNFNRNLKIKKRTLKV